MPTPVPWSQRFASMKTLTAVFPTVSAENLTLIREICRGDVYVDELKALAEKMELPNLYYMLQYDTVDLALHVINDLLWGCGVEAIGVDECHGSSHRGERHR